MRERRGADAWRTCHQVRDLVVVCSSSRGGSSLFGELLRRSARVLTFSAEINPHVMIPTLGSGGGCDVVADPSPWTGTGDGLKVLQTELGLDLGRPARTVDVAELAAHVAWRLTMQWPTEAIEPDVVHGWTAQVVGSETRVEAPGRSDLLARLLPLVRAAHPTVDPQRYDTGGATAAAMQHPPPRGPTAEPVVEMAPFVLPRAWQRATPDDAVRAPVVVTTPRNAFRLPLLAAAFPNARLRVLHLTRNPAAAVNGLRDGWLHHGFFSAPAEQPLAIDGYSDVHPAWGTRWWNYDVPPDWRSWTERPLVEVCAHQWRSAHETTVEAADRLGLEVRRVAFEDIVAPGDRRAHALRELAGWLDVDPASLLGDERLPVVMPTAPPRVRRWEDNADVLQPVLTDAEVRDTARALGYSGDPADWE